MEAATPEGGGTAAIRRAPFVYALIVLDAVVLSLLTVAAGGAFDWWLIVLGVVAVGALALPVPAWLSRWAPMLLIAVVFLALGGLAQHQGPRAASTLPIQFDRAVSGVVVPVWLQQHTAALIGPLAGVLTAEYLLHYATPLLTAWWLWRRHRERFDGFVATYMLAMVLGFAVYLAFPQTPPWYAAQQGLLPHLHRNIVEVLQSIHLGALYAGADPEPFGAMPSLHVTIPVVVAAELIGVARSRWRWSLVLYPATVAFGVLLMAEHYLIDTLGGAALGVVAVVVVRSLPTRVLSGRGRGHHTKGISRRVVRAYSMYSRPRR